MTKRATIIVALIILLFIVPDTESAGLRSARRKFNRKDYNSARQNILRDLPSMRGKTLIQAKLILAKLHTSVSAAEAILNEVSSSGQSNQALEANLELAKIQYSMGNYSSAAEILGGVTTGNRNSDRLEAIYLRGLALKEMGDIENARKDFESIDRGENLYWAYMALAEIDMQTGRIDRAIDRYEMIAGSHSNPIAGFKLGECYEISGDTEKALDTYRTTAHNFPESPEAPKAREKVQKMEASLRRSGRRKSQEGGDEGGRPFRESWAIPGDSPKYTLQFGAFSERSNALAFVADLGNMIDGLRTEEVESGGVVWHRVRVGAYDTREEAEEAALQIMEKTGYSSKVLPLD
jgi:tetratricopeptide (TPR) repeat protein